MKIIVITSLWFCLISTCLAKPPLFLSYQDSIGQYSFGYSDPESARSEYRTADGLTRGTYSYIDRNGLIQTAEYEAGGDFGFRVKATNLPQAPLPVHDTPEVIAAREYHLQLLDEARRREEHDRALKIADGNVDVLDRRPVNVDQTPETKVAPSVMTAHAVVSAPLIEPRNAGLGKDIEAKAEESPVVPQVKNVPEQQDETIAKAAASVPLHISREVIPKTEGKIEIESRSSNQPISDQSSKPIPTPEIAHPLSAVPVQAEISQEVISKNSGKVEFEARSVGQQQASIPISFPPILTRNPVPAFPQPVGYTPEVMAAREAHFRAYETAAKLAAETDANPKLLEQLLRGQAMALTLPGENKVENREFVGGSNVDEKIEGFKVASFAQPISNSEASVKRVDTIRLGLPMMDNSKDKVVEKAQLNEMSKSIDTGIAGSGLTPASTSLRVMDIRFPSLNEFQQTKLKAGAYNTPIEISHLSPTNLLPKPYHPFFGSSSFYVYL